MDDIQSNYSKILVRRSDAMGDILMATPIIRKLYNDRNGKCFIDFQLHEHHKDTLTCNPFIRNIIPSNQPLQEKYDLIIDLDLIYEKRPSLHVIDAYAELAFGNNNFDKSIDLFTDQLSKQLADNLKNNLQKDYIVLHVRNYPGTSRNINLDFWNQLVLNILNNTELYIVFIGQNSDVAFSSNERLIDLRHQINLLTVKEIIANAKMFIGSDTGTLHVAGTTNTDIIGLFTSVRSEYRQPFRIQGKFIPIAADIECYGCQEKYTPPVCSIDCLRGDYECQNRFDAGKVADIVIKLYNKTNV